MGSLAITTIKSLAIQYMKFHLEQIHRNVWWSRKIIKRIRIKFLFQNSIRHTVTSSNKKVFFFKKNYFSIVECGRINVEWDNALVHS